MPQIDIKLKSTADTSGFDKTKQAAAGVGTAFKGAAGGVGDMTQKLSEAEIKAGAGKDVIEGLSYAAKGGEGAFFGLTKAAGAFFSVLNASPVMALVSAVGLLYAGMKLLTGKIVESATAWEKYDEKIKPLEDDYKRVGEAAKVALEAQLKRLKEVAEAYDDLAKAAARSRKEIEQINSAQQKLDIAKVDSEEASLLRTAKTEKERDDIKQKYDAKRLSIRTKYEDVAAENERLSAQLQIRESEDQIRKIQTERDRIDADIRDKRAQFESLLAISKDVLASGGSGSDVMAATREAMLSKRALDEAMAGKSTFEERARKQEEKAYEDARAARASISVGDIEAKARGIERETEKSKAYTQAPAATQAEIDALGKEAEEAAARGDWAAQDAAVAKRRALLQAGRKPSPVTTYAPRTSAEKAGQQPGANEPASSGQLPDLATPLRDAAQKAGDSATQSADSIQAAADAAKAVADNTKPLDASALTAALQSAATAQQTASTQTAAGMQQMVSLAQQQVTLAQQQYSEMSKLRSQVENLRQRVTQLSSRAA